MQLQAASSECARSRDNPLIGVVRGGRRMLYSVRMVALYTRTEQVFVPGIQKHGWRSPRTILGLTPKCPGSHFRGGAPNASLYTPPAPSLFPYSAASQSKYQECITYVLYMSLIAPFIISCMCEIPRAPALPGDSSHILISSRKLHTL